jgi:nucleotide-binding universal stress UspA family protein
MTVIVGVDGSPSSREALAFAIEEGRLRRQVVCAVYAWSAPLEGVGGGQLAGGPVYEASAGELRELQSVAEQRLSELVAELDGGEGVERRAVLGRPAEVLVGLAGDGDLLVVGSRGHGALAATLLGSVSHACTQHASCPVVVVRSSRRPVDWQVADVIGRERARNAETWEALRRLGVAEGTELALSFAYESAGADADAALAAHLQETTGYVVELDETGVNGETQPIALSPAAIDDWVEAMVRAGHEHGGCMFGGWTATVEQDATAGHTGTASSATTTG